MKRLVAVVLIVSLASIAALAQTRRRTVRVPPGLVPSFGEPLLNLDAKLTAAFIQGRAEFGGRRFQFSGDALLNELGITSPHFPDENCPSGNCAELEFNPRPSLNDDGRLTRALADFMMLLAPPPRGPITSEVTEGERVFERIGCAACHVSTLQTGPNANPAFDRITYHPYSDFLLHDTSGRSLELAISKHDGQAAASRNRFNALSEADRTKLLAFLGSL